MKTKKDTVSKESILHKVKSKRKTSIPKANDSLKSAVKNVQQIFKDKNAEIKVVKEKSNLRKANKKTTETEVKRSVDNKGVVYIGHIPHGFYEKQMKDYFGQFGKVTRVRVVRSKRTGKSRGYGYVEFLQAEVAKIAAETMHNYLMCNRLLKATYIPPEKQHPGFFSGVNWSETMYPRLRNRKQVTLSRNRVSSTEDHKRYVRSALDKLSMLEKKLQKKGISIKFQPVDVPKT